MSDLRAAVAPHAERTAGLVLRPSPRSPRARRMLVEAGILWLVIAAVTVVAEVSGGFLVGWIILALATVWYSLLPWLYFRNASLYVAGDRAGKTDLLGRPTEVDRARVASLRLTRAGRRSRSIQLEDAAGTTLLSVYSTAWRRAQVETLRRALGLSDEAPG